MLVLTFSNSQTVTILKPPRKEVIEFQIYYRNLFIGIIHSYFLQLNRIKVLRRVLEEMQETANIEQVM